MNRLKYIKAVAHPRGNRVDLRWLNPKPVEYPGVRVVGRPGTHPTSPSDGHLVAEATNNLLFTLDLSYGHHLDNKIVSTALAGQFVFHQIMVTTDAVVSVIVPGNQWEISEDEEVYLVNRDNDRLDIYGLSGATDTGLPPGQVLYYTLFPYTGQPLRHEFNPMNRVTCFATDSMDYGGRMYRQLPVIYHRYDTRLPLPHQVEKAGMTEAERQQGQLRRFLDLTGTHLDQFHSFATAALHLHDMQRVDGNLLPLLGQWIGWNTLFNNEVAGQRNEIRYAPELLQTLGQIPTIETLVRLITGMENQTREMANNVFITNRPEELNFWLAHRDNTDNTGAWTPEKEVFSLDMAYAGRPSAVRDESDVLWLFYHICRNNDWDIWYKTFREDQGWTPSKPLTEDPAVDTHPCAVLRDKTLMVSWNSFDEENQSWSIKYKENTGGTWTEPAVFDHGITGTGVQRKSPCAIVDKNNKVWLFWLETDTAETNLTQADQWKLKFNRFDGTQWELPQAEDFPHDGISDPRVGTDIFAVVRTVGTTESIVLVWTRSHIDADGTIRGKEIACREKTGTASTSGGWGPVVVMPKIQSPFLYHDCEPYALAGENGEIDLYWSSNRSGAYAVWNIRLTDMATLDSAAAVRVVNSVYSQRYPAAFPSGDGTTLVYRSNQGISYQGASSRSANQADFRRAGCIALDHRDRQMNLRIGKFNDCLTYTYDTGENGIPNNSTWYTCDTIGIYLTPDSDDIEAILKKVKTLETVIRQFLPLHTRAVFILKPFVTHEPVYTYGLPDADQPHFIIEKIDDTVQTEVYPGINETHTDRVPSWSLLKSWSTAVPESKSADFSVTPAETGSRSWHIALAWE